VLLALAFWRPRQPVRLQWLAPISLVGAGLLAAAAWQSVVTIPDGRLHLTVLAADDVPVVLVQSPDGKRMLINGQSDSRALSSDLGKRIPLFGHHLDGLLLTGSSPGALEGLPAVLARFPAQAAFWSRTIPSSAALDALQVGLTAQTTPISLLDAGEELDLGGGVHLQVLVASADGAALLVQYGRFSALLPGGITPDALSAVDLTLPPDVLVLGAKDAVQPGAVDLTDWSQFQPGLVVWQGDPRLQQSDGPAWLNLAEHGWAVITSDGQKMWIEVER
jgi:hypothetical protein